MSLQPGQNFWLRAGPYFNGPGPARAHPYSVRPSVPQPVLRPNKQVLLCVQERGKSPPPPTHVCICVWDPWLALANKNGGKNVLVGRRFLVGLIHNKHDIKLHLFVLLCLKKTPLCCCTKVLRICFQFPFPHGRSWLRFPTIQASMPIYFSSPPLPLFLQLKVGNLSSFFAKNTFFSPSGPSCCRIYRTWVQGGKFDISALDPPPPPPPRLSI